MYQRTEWSERGKVVRQYRQPGGARFPLRQTSPPWLWGVTDQSEPTMPAWMKDDEKWAKALEEAR